MIDELRELACEIDPIAKYDPERCRALAEKLEAGIRAVVRQMVADGTLTVYRR